MPSLAIRGINGVTFSMARIASGTRKIRKNTGEYPGENRIIYSGPSGITASASINARTSSAVNTYTFEGKSRRRACGVMHSIRQPFAVTALLNT